ncbi:MAG: hypothetical protein PPP58_12525 [Natronomonas sp.]
MEESRARKLRFVTLQLVGAVAVIHLIAGIAETARLASAGLLGAYLTGEFLTQPEMLLFVTSSIAILAGILAVGLGYLDHRRAYALGILAMLTFIVGWLAWHTVFDHGMAFGGEAGGDGHSHGDHSHGEEAGHEHGGLLTVIVSHYVEPLVGVFTGVDQPGQTVLAVISKTLEVIALLALSILFVADPKAQPRDGSTASKDADLAADDSEDSEEGVGTPEGSVGSTK